MKKIFARIVIANVLCSLVLGASKCAEFGQNISGSHFFEESYHEADILSGERIQTFADVIIATDFWIRFHTSFRRVCGDCRVIRVTEDESEFEISQQDKQLVHSARVIFIYSAVFRQFGAHIFPHIGDNVILLTHNGDEDLFPTQCSIPSPPNTHVDQHCPANDAQLYDALTVLDSPQIRHWFAQNAAYSHPKLTPLPIGIANQMWPHGDAAAVAAVARRGAELDRRPGLVYVNFKASEHAPRRAAVLRALSALGLATIRPAPIDYAGYLEEMSEHRFCAAPEGHGIDTHRMWEALYVGTIPLVDINGLTSSLAGIKLREDGSGADPAPGRLPIVTVSNWSAVTAEALDAALDLAVEGRWAWSMLRLDWWRRAVAACRDSDDGPD